jgi:hypothetical protein
MQDRTSFAASPAGGSRMLNRRLTLPVKLNLATNGIFQFFR